MIFNFSSFLNENIHFSFFYFEVEYFLINKNYNSIEYSLWVIISWFLLLVNILSWRPLYNCVKWKSTKILREMLVYCLLLRLPKLYYYAYINTPRNILLPNMKFKKCMLPFKKVKTLIGFEIISVFDRRITQYTRIILISKCATEEHFVNFTCISLVYILSIIVLFLDISF